MDLKHHDVKYKRWIYLTVTFVIILAGLASRKYGNALPKFIAEYIGDTLGQLWSIGDYAFSSLRHPYSKWPQSPYCFLIA